MGQELTIGRAYSNLLRLEGDEISRVHGIIYRRGGDYILRDLDSKNGLFLNGQKVTTSIISGDDEVRIGNYVILFDPSSEFDMTGFLQRHNVQYAGQSPQPENDGPGTASGKLKNEQVLEAEPAVAEVDESRPVVEPAQVFFGVAETEQLSDSSYGTYSAMFFSDLLRMHRRLSLPFSLDANGSFDPLQVHFLNAAVASVGADRGVIVLKESGSDVLRLAAIYPREKDIAVNRTVLRAALRNREAVLCNNVMQDDRFLQTDTVVKERIGSLIAYPLIRGEGVLGLVYCDVREKANAFRREHLLLLHFLSRLLLLTMDREDRR